MPINSLTLSEARHLLAFSTYSNRGIKKILPLETCLSLWTHTHLRFEGLWEQASARYHAKQLAVLSRMLRGHGRTRAADRNKLSPTEVWQGTAGPLLQSCFPPEAVLPSGLRVAHNKALDISKMGLCLVFLIHCFWESYALLFLAEKKLGNICLRNLSTCL